MIIARDGIPDSNIFIDIYKTPYGKREMERETHTERNT